MTQVHPPSIHAVDECSQSVADLKPDKVTHGTVESTEHHPSNYSTFMLSGFCEPQIKSTCRIQYQRVCVCIYCSTAVYM